jgi:hypothetical protein
LFDIHERGGPDVGHSCLYINCHVVIFAETMDQRDLEQEQLLGEIILAGGDVLSFLNDTDGTMEEEGHDHDGSGDRMPEEEGDHDDGSGDRTEEGAVAKSGEVYILIKPVLTS